MDNALSNMTLLQKADLALADLTNGGGYLQPDNAQQFIRLLIDEASLMKQAYVFPMKTPQMLMPKARFGSRVLHAGQVNQPLPQGSRSKPDITSVELDAKLFKAEVNIPEEVLEDNIEKDAFKNTVMQMFAERIALDMDEMAVNGDVTSADPDLAKFDGILKQITSHVVDMNGAPFTRDVFRYLLRALPREYRRNLPRLRYLAGVNVELDWRDDLASRETIEGDRALLDGGAARYGGIPVLPISVLPEEGGAGENESQVVLTDPKNIVYGIYRAIKIETDKDVRAGTHIFVASLRYDVKLIEESAASKATEIVVGV